MFYLKYFTTATCSGGVDLVSTDDSGSTFTARWRARGNRVEFELTGRGQGWVGIGFSYNRIMVIVLCYYLLLAQHFTIN